MLVLSATNLDGARWCTRRVDEIAPSHGHLAFQAIHGGVAFRARRYFFVGRVYGRSAPLFMVCRTYPHTEASLGKPRKGRAA